MSYLADVKKSLRGIFEEAFDFVWDEAEKSLKQSYRNGYDAGVKAAKEGDAGTEQASSATPRRQWRRGSRQPAPEGGES
jgi:hypothetical protein